MMKPELNGLWTIYDLATGFPAEQKGATFTDLSEPSARNALDMLNSMEIQNRIEEHILRGDLP